LAFKDQNEYVWVWVGAYDSYDALIK
jgi:hypothetical protein